MDVGERPSITIRILERLLKLIRITNVFFTHYFFGSSTSMDFLDLLPNIKGNGGDISACPLIVKNTTVVAKRSSGVTPEVNLRIPLHTGDEMGSTLA